MIIFQQLLLAISLCADSFAVSLCSSVTLKRTRLISVIRVAFAFAVIHSSLLLAGWLFGNLFVGFVEKIADIVGFLLLLYVGGSMCLDGIRGKDEIRNLHGFRNIILGGIATSIDALAVGAAKSITDKDVAAFQALLLILFVITVLSVIAGIYGGRFLGKKTGRTAEICGGLVLIAIGITLLF